MTVVISLSIGILVLLIAMRIRKWGSSASRIDLISVAALCLILCMLLFIPAIYVKVDSWLGGKNVANLLSHMLVYVVFWIVGIQVASAMRLPQARALITGRVGWVATGIVVVATVALFATSSLPASSMGLLAYVDQPSVEAYLILGRLYPAIIACLLVNRRSWSTAAAISLPLLRISSLMTLFGVALIIPGPIFQALHAYMSWASVAEDICAFGGSALVALGSALTLVSKWTAPQQRGALRH